MLLLPFLPFSSKTPPTWSYIIFYHYPNEKDIFGLVECFHFHSHYIIYVLSSHDCLIQLFIMMISQHYNIYVYPSDSLLLSLFKAKQHKTRSFFLLPIFNILNPLTRESSLFSYVNGASVDVVLVLVSLLSCRCVCTRYTNRSLHSS